MDLFSMGVFDDPDRPKQHRPTPVRCYEDELAPRVLKPAKVCEACCLTAPMSGKALCTVCQRERDCDARGERRRLDRKAEARVLDQALRTGWVVPQHYNRHTIERMVADGTLRWLSGTERRRYGLAKFDDVAVLKAQP